MTWNPRLQKESNSLQFNVYLKDKDCLKYNENSGEDVLGIISKSINQPYAVSRKRLYNFKGNVKVLKERAQPYFTVYEAERGDPTVGPLEKCRIEREDGMTRVEYINGIVEEMIHSRHHEFEGRRRFPSGVEEVGIFCDYTLELNEGKRIENMRTVYVRGVKTLHELFIEGNCNLLFGLVNEELQKKVYVFEEIGTNEFVMYTDQRPEFAASLLLKMVLSDDKMRPYSYRTILESLEDPRAFILSLLESIQPQNTLPIFSLDSDLFFSTLKKAQELSIEIDLITPDSATGSNLFHKHLKSRNSELNSLMIESDPRVLSRRLSHEKTPLTSAFLDGNKEKAKVYLEAMEKHHLQLSLQEVWLKRVFENDLDFTDDEFKQLAPATQKRAYRVAHAFNCIAWVERLNRLGMAVPKLQRDETRLFSIDMDAVELNQSLQAYLYKLRAAQRILTQDEFDDWNKKNQQMGISKDYAGTTRTHAWIKKGRGIDRLIGRDRIESAIHQLGVKSVKVPSKIAVIPSSEHLTMLLHVEMDQTYNLDVFAQDVEVYAQEIKRSSRKISRKEMVELIAVMQMVQYGDIHDFNFVVAEDGVYFIDTESKSFYGTLWEKVVRLITLLDFQDHLWFRELVQKNQDLQSASRQTVNPSSSAKDPRKKIAKFAGFNSQTKKEYQINLR
ncbi:MAG: hypothetical protein BGO14_02595 [Chlamydiales bacterium 38-26]|nr:hypothetical protein [Chlamydiales bacterium]OJV09241.1 MAG: hypothetical protein BGO14_02595 [Chlamydiales bacterium 38-26]